MLNKLPESAAIKNQGMTLIEIMIAVVLLSLIALSLGAGMSTMGDTLTKVSARVEQLDQIRLTSAFLRRSLAATYFDFYTQEGGEKALFQGRGKKMIWLSNLCGSQGPGGLHILSLGLKKRGANADLVLDIYPWRPGMDLSKQMKNPVTREILASGVNEFKLRYRNKTGGWSDAWEDSKSIPVEISLRIRSENRQWPEIVVPINNYTIN